MFTKTRLFLRTQVWVWFPHTRLWFQHTGVWFWHAWVWFWHVTVWLQHLRVWFWHELECFRHARVLHAACGITKNPDLVLTSGLTTCTRLILTCCVFNYFITIYTGKCLWTLNYCTHASQINTHTSRFNSHACSKSTFLI
jgi:hypothetical protein